MSYGADLRTWRKRHLMSQQQLAEQVGLTERTIHNIEAEKHKPNYQTQRRLRAIRDRYKKAKLS